MDPTEKTDLLSYFDKCSQFNIIFHPTEEKILFDAGLRFSETGLYNKTSAGKRSLCLSTLRKNIINLYSDPYPLIENMLLVSGPIFFSKVTQNDSIASVGMFYLESRKYQLPIEGKFINRRINRALSEQTDIKSWFTYYTASDTMSSITLDTLHELATILGQEKEAQEFAVNRYRKNASELGPFSFPDSLYAKLDEFYEDKNRIITVLTSKNQNVGFADLLITFDNKIKNVYHGLIDRLYDQHHRFLLYHYKLTDGKANESEGTTGLTDGWFDWTDTVTYVTFDTLYRLSNIFGFTRFAYSFAAKNFLKIADQITFNPNSPTDFYAKVDLLFELKYRMLTLEIQNDPNESLMTCLKQLDGPIREIYQKSIDKLYEKINQKSVEIL